MYFSLYYIYAYMQMILYIHNLLNYLRILNSAILFCIAFYYYHFLSFKSTSIHFSRYFGNCHPKEISNIDIIGVLIMLFLIFFLHFAQKSSLYFLMFHVYNLSHYSASSLYLLPLLKYVVWMLKT